MSTLAFPDEVPTRPRMHVPESTVILAERVIRSVDLAVERLTILADSDSIEATIGDLLELKARAQGVIA